MKHTNRIKNVLFVIFKQRILFLLCFMLVWETVYQLKIFPLLLFPSIKDIFLSLITGITEESLLLRAAKSLSLIFEGIFIALGIALLLMGLTLKSNLCKNIVENLTIYLNPIPGMAVFPLCILWFGLGRNAIIFIMIHSVLWGLVINLTTGAASIPPRLKEIGENMELSKLRMLTDIYIPASLPYLIAGTKAAFARAWRTAISVELVVGVVSNNEGLGWLMNRQRNLIDISGLFSTIIIIIIIGVFLEDVVFRVIENATVKKWGMIR